MQYSVIVPVYNAEKTLRRCVDSLITQGLDQTEILLVNDGSKDGSKAICAEYTERYHNVRLIDKPNGGVSSARNAGLDVAVGDYILFVDSDDYVPSDLFLAFSHLLQEYSWDLIRLSSCVDDGHSLHERIAAPVAFRSREDTMPQLIADICSKALNSPWAKLYKREILKQHHIRFPLGVSVAEDRAFNIHYSLYVQSYRVSEQLGYFVNTENEQSLSRKHHADLESQFKIVDAYTEQAISDAGIPAVEQDQYQRAINFARCRSIYKTAKDLRRDHLSWMDRQKALWKQSGQINRQHMKYPSTRYCRIITLPVRLRLTVGIDLIAKRLLK